MNPNHLSPRQYSSLSIGNVSRGPSRSSPQPEDSKMLQKLSGNDVVDAKVREATESLMRTVDRELQHVAQTTAKEVSKMQELQGSENKQLRSDLGDARRQIEELSIRFEMERHSSAEQRHLINFLMNKQGGPVRGGSHIFEATDGDHGKGSISWQIAEYVYIIAISVLRSASWLLQPVMWAFSSMELIRDSEEADATRHASEGASSHRNKMMKAHYEVARQGLNWHTATGSPPPDIRLRTAYDASTLGASRAQLIYDAECSHCLSQ